MSGRHPTARSLAADVLLRVFRDGSFAAATLDAELERQGLLRADRALATELVYGVLRTEPALLSRIARFAKKLPTDLEVRCHLLVGAYQIELLDRVPVHAAVNEAVALARRGRDARVGGFVNAVLRKVAALAKSEPLGQEAAAWLSVPEWLRARLVGAVGEAEARALVSPVTREAPTIRLRPGRALPADVAMDFEPAARCPDAYRYRAGGDPRRLPSFEAGDFLVQELGAQLLARMLEPVSGERILDVCAGRGHKTTVLADIALGADVTAADVHTHKVTALGGEMARLGLGVKTLVHDFRLPLPEELRGTFDAVLVDAPCTGVGTLRRRPEIRLRLDQGDSARLAALQVNILRTALGALRPGGRLVYATCSVLPEECEGVLERVSDLASPRTLSAALVGAEGLTIARLLPLRDGTDGYFVAGLTRKLG